MLDEMADLLLGAQCPGCGAPSWRLCEDCRRVVSRPARPLDDAVALGPLLSGRAACAGDWDGPVRQLVTAFKDRGSWGLRRVLGGQLALAVRWVLDGVLQDGCLEGTRQVVLVPVPSSPKAVRTRGFDHSRVLADTAARLLREGDTGGLRVDVARPLRRVRAVADQSGLGRAERRRNQHRTMRAAPPAGCRCAVVIDDVCTTGASLSEAARALTEAGWTVLGAAVVAHPSHPVGRREDPLKVFLPDPLKGV